MRNAFVSELEKIAGENQSVVLLSGDMGNQLFNSFKSRFPDNFYNCGVAEANMTGVAAGMALCGLKPITYSIAPFSTLRCLEQIKIDICYHNLPVIIVGVGAGLSYAELGTTHHSLEDIALLKAFPNMTILCPGDAFEVRGALRAAVKHNGPVYLRMGKKNEPLVYDDVPEVTIGKGIVVRQGRDICLLATGNLLPIACEAAELLKKKDISSQVVSMHTVKPLDIDLITDVCSQFKIMATIEEHNINGGLGGSIAEWLAYRHEQRIQLLRFGTPDRFLRRTGPQSRARDVLGLTADKLKKAILKSLERV